MKTAEELANEKYSDISYPKDIASVDDYTTNEIRLLQRIAYVAGYTEAMRWRDPDVELPVDSCDVLVKTAEDIYYVVYFCLEREGFFHEHCRLQGVIGWRSIE